MKTKKAAAIFLLILIVLLCIMLIYGGKMKSGKANFDQVNKLKDVTMEVNSVTAEGATLVLRNRSNKTYYTNGAYTIEKKGYWGWSRMDTIVPEDEIFIESIAYRVEGEWTLDCDWEWLYGSLPAGEYLIVKAVRAEGMEGYPDGENVYLATEFKVE